MNSSLRCLAVAAMTFLLAPRSARAEVVSSLHPLTGPDGANPCAGLVLSNGRLYGTTFNSGPALYGTVFQVNTDGSGFTNLHAFNGIDGANPCCALLITNGYIYGSTEYSDSSGIGAIFKMALDGSGFTNLHTFFDADGGAPSGQLAFWGDFLYGTTQDGGAWDSGTLFRMKTDGTGFTNLYNFSPVGEAGANSDGAKPFGGLILLGDMLYGATPLGGTGGSGGIFRIGIDGTGFTNFYTFGPLVSGTNADGASPYGTLLLSGGLVYGTTLLGGSVGYGTVFRINTDGSDFTSLHDFVGTASPASTNLGSFPFGALVLRGTTLYGTTEDRSGQVTTGTGTVFELSTDGSGFSTVYSFTPLTSGGLVGVQTNSDGAYPRAGLTSVGNTLFGTTWSGGSQGSGSIFALALAPSSPLLITLGETAVVLSWPDQTFSLQSSPTVSAPFESVPGATSPYTNVIAGPQRFFRLGPK